MIPVDTPPKTILFIDRYPPEIDKDAGSKTIFQYLNLFINSGFNVKFVSDDPQRKEPYSTATEKMGIQVLYNSSGFNERWLNENGKTIDYVILNRPYLSKKYIDLVKKKTHAKIIFYGHDLHFLREKREYKITKKPALLLSAFRNKITEMNLMKKADITYYPSQIEIDEIKKHNPSISAKAIPAYIYENKPNLARDFKNTKDIMFIGGFAHKPNVDGILWYINEIYPFIKKELPTIKTYILGSNVPEEILKLNSENLVVAGFVTEEQLSCYYKNCRLSIVPLRYGAGVKGKVVEAMYNQLPVVTTSIGAEGINGAEQCLFIKDKAKEFAREIIRVYDNHTLLSEMSLKEIEVINKEFSISAATKIITEDFS